MEFRWFCRNLTNNEAFTRDSKGAILYENGDQIPPPKKNESRAGGCFGNGPGYMKQIYPPFTCFNPIILIIGGMGGQEAKGGLGITVFGTVNIWNILYKRKIKVCVRCS